MSHAPQYRIVFSGLAAYRKGEVLPAAAIGDEAEVERYLELGAIESVAPETPTPPDHPTGPPFGPAPMVVDDATLDAIAPTVVPAPSEAGDATPPVSHSAAKPGKTHK